MSVSLSMIMSHLHLNVHRFHGISQQLFDVRERKRWKRGYNKGTWHQRRETSRTWTLETISLVLSGQDHLSFRGSQRTPRDVCCNCITAPLFPPPWPAPLIDFRYYICRHFCSKMAAHKSMSQSVFIGKLSHSCLQGEEAEHKVPFWVRVSLPAPVSFLCGRTWGLCSGSTWLPSLETVSVRGYGWPPDSVVPFNYL